VFGGLFFLAAIAMAGLPPLSGFTGKILILEALRPSPAWGWLWALLLTTSLIVIVGFARAGTTLFWKSEAMGVEAPPSLQHRSPSLPTAAAAALLAGTILLSLFAGPATRHLEATAAQILDTRSYVEAVLGPSRADPAARTERTP
jgi:multicomponent K+:H+ antiporter subunit D